MKNLLLLFFMAVLFGSCRKLVSDNCIFLKQTEGWQTENFKSKYTIQFPADYTGTGMIGFEGNIFYKKKDAIKNQRRYRRKSDSDGSIFKNEEPRIR